MAEDKPTEVLIIGAGNIGRVYGYHLSKAGVKVHYYVREHHRQNLTSHPLRLHRLTSVFRFLNKSSTEKFSDYTITTDTDIANGQAPNLPEQLNYVIFTVPAHSLSEGDWLKTLIAFLKGKYQNNLYYTSPVPDETGFQRLLDLGIEKEKLISAQTGIVSYFAPLPTQRFEPRGEDTAKKDDEENNPNKVIVYCLTTPELFGNLTPESKEPTNQLIKLLNNGGLRSINIGRDTEYGLLCLMLTSLLVSFGSYNWNFYNAGKDLSLMSLTTASLAEISNIIVKKTKGQCQFLIKMVPFVPTLLFAAIVIFIHLLSVYVCSFDIEAFCQGHFKVKLDDQTNYWIGVVQEEAKTYESDITNFQKLIEVTRTASKKNE